jgi:hypothetical protein
MKKIIAGISFFIVATIIGLHFTIFSETPMWQIPSLLNASRAKEFCSCHFLLGKGHAYCLKRVNHGYPMLGYEVNEQRRFVRFDFLWNSRTATVVSDRLGCQLD